MWMFPSCLSAALMASYKDPSLHSHLRRKQEVTPLSLHIKFRSFRKTTSKFTKVNATLSFLFCVFERVGSQYLLLPNSGMGHIAPMDTLTHSHGVPKVSAWSCRCRCYFSLQLLGAVDNQSWVSVTCLTWVWITYGLCTHPDAEQIYKPAGTSGNRGKTEVLP